MKKVCMIGLGYIGLPTAAVMASNGLKVVGVDINEKAVEIINNGKIHIIEPGLEDLVSNVVSNGFLKAQTTPETADVFVIAVPTPFKDEHEPNLDYIEIACKNIAKVLKKGDLVILESTSPIGATEKMSHWMSVERKDLSFPHLDGENSDIRVAHCPERVLPGQVIEELKSNDRVIGGITSKCTEKAVEFYNKFVDGECIKTNARTAEMAKLTENASRDVQIAFANELSVICDKADINVWELIELANRHPRVNILQPGAGVGGHCIAVDPWFIVSQFPHESHLIKTARNVNDGKPLFIISKTEEYIKQNNIQKPKIACLGLAFKPNIDDLRESPALEITKMISDIPDTTVFAVEPNITELPPVLKNRNNVELVNIEDALEKSDIVLILVGHTEFLNIDTSKDNILSFVKI